jgi:hypothetical protein
MLKLNIYLLAAICCFAILVAGCTKNDTDETNNIDPNFQLKEKFAAALSAAVNDVSVRSFLRMEAQAQFDSDFDILYQAVKEKMLDNGQTFRESLLKYINVSDLKSVENTFPLLTIFVPALPENSFSVYDWDVRTQCPKVAVRSMQSQKIPIYENSRLYATVNKNMIPSYPVIVVKDNERIRENTAVSGLYNFLDSNFDHSELANTVMSDEKNIDAYHKCLYNNGWQRDYIYYNIVESSDNGVFLPEFKECLTSFRFVGSPAACYQKIFPDWAEGNVEIKIKFHMNKSAGIGYEYIRYFQVDVNHVFDITYAKKGDYYYADHVAHNEVVIDMPLFAWDVSEYCENIKIELELFDYQDDTEISHTGSIDFLDNFIRTGDHVQKIGALAGTRKRKTIQCITAGTITHNYSAPLGGAIFSFSDPVLIDEYNKKRYSTGICEFFLEPKVIIK